MVLLLLFFLTAGTKAPSGPSADAGCGPSAVGLREYPVQYQRRSLERSSCPSASAFGGEGAARVHLYAQFRFASKCIRRIRSLWRTGLPTSLPALRKAASMIVRMYCAGHLQLVRGACRPVQAKQLAHALAASAPVRAPNRLQVSAAWRSDTACLFKLLPKLPLSAWPAECRAAALQMPAPTCTPSCLQQRPSAGAPCAAIALLVPPALTGHYTLRMVRRERRERPRLQGLTS